MSVTNCISGCRVFSMLCHGPCFCAEWGLTGVANVDAMVRAGAAEEWTHGGVRMIAFKDVWVGTEEGNVDEGIISKASVFLEWL